MGGGLGLREREKLVGTKGIFNNKESFKKEQWGTRLGEVNGWGRREGEPRKGNANLHERQRTGALLSKNSVDINFNTGKFGGNKMKKTRSAKKGPT